jgi:hypothetical protein
MVENTDTNIRTFNGAKLFIEQVVFPLQLDYKKFQRQAQFGTDKLEESINITEEVRDILRFNGLKGMGETCGSLILAISSTVKLKGNKEENKELDLLTELIYGIQEIFYGHKERFFETDYKNGVNKEVLNRSYFNSVKNIIDVSYINTEILMTKNKLLFSDASDEYKEDAEIMQQIKDEYIEG